MRSVGCAAGSYEHDPRSTLTRDVESRSSTSRWPRIPYRTSLGILCKHGFASVAARSQYSPDGDAGGGLPGSFGADVRTGVRSRLQGREPDPSRKKPGSWPGLTASCDLLDMAAGAL